MRYVAASVIAFSMLAIPFSLFADSVTVAVSQQNDDAEEEITGANAGNVQRTSPTLELGNNDGVEQWVGLRFQSLAIPVGSTINSASIRFTAEQTDVGTLVIPFLENSLPTRLSLGTSRH